MNSYLIYFVTLQGLPMKRNKIQLRTNLTQSCIARDDLATWELQLNICEMLIIFHCFSIIYAIIFTSILNAPKKGKAINYKAEIKNLMHKNFKQIIITKL